MKKTVKSIDKILPFGESIRGFLNQSFLTETDMRIFLRNRGVFLSDYNKIYSVPFITTTLLSPEEFDSLKESQGTREDNPKRTNEILHWEGSKTLKEVINEIRTSIIQDLTPKNCNYRLISNPQIIFNQFNDNEVKIALEIERDDLNKSWYESKNGFKAEVLVNLDVDKKQLQITKTHTSDETKHVVGKLTRNLRSSFVEKGYVDSTKKIETIIFSHFDNTRRFFFLFNLAKKLDDKNFSVEFKDIIDIEFKPELDALLPDELKWMNDKSKVILKGKDIHNTNFLLNIENYQLLIVWNVEALYRFDLGGVQGSLSLQIGFPDYSRGNNDLSELIITPNKINVFDRTHVMKKGEILKKLLDQIDKIKFDIYEKFKII